ncbi:hypothetical protein OTU49_001588 [Cherax quadricarinatus]|uniref:Malate dehydrogenase, cytoplasmic n=1 Tax=Cherax quadricarinatus TaxID=27406 RepID=A0AAW0YQC5_CHEQU
MAEPIRVCITGAAGQIGYSLVYMVGSGAVFGPDTPVILHLLDIKPMMTVLNGVCMEISDCALPCVRDVIATDDPAVAFKDIESAFLVGSMPRKEGMERKDLLAANVKIFKVQAQISAKLGIPVTDVKNVIIWGNHSSTQFPDVRHASAIVNGQTVSVYDAIKDDAFLKGEFITSVQKRGAAVIAARKLSSAMSAAKAACDHMRSIWEGTSEGHFVSMGVFSDGSYNLPEGVMYSFPVTIKDKKWSIVQGLPIDDFAQEMMDKSAKELCEERDDAIAVCED